MSVLDNIHVALVGAGRHGRDLLNYCLDMPDVRFRAVCDIWPYAQKYASGILKKRGQPVAVYEDLDEMLAAEKDLQAAIIATPDSFHADQTIACLKAGLHVYCEKEMHTTVAGARAMVRQARRTGRLLQIGRQHRSNPRYLAALDYIHARKAVGRILAVFGQWHGHKRVPYTWPKAYEIPAETLSRYGYASMDEHRNWRWLSKFSAGEVVNLAAHQIDVFNWVLGRRPRAVMAAGGLDYYDLYELHDNATCLLEWDFTWQGVTKTVRGAHRTLTMLEGGGFYEVFLGEEGTLVISEDPLKGGIVRAPDSPMAAWEKGLRSIDLEAALKLAGRMPLWEPFDDYAIDRGRLYGPLPGPPDEKPPHWYHLRNFFDAVHGRCKLSCPAEAGFEGAVSALAAAEAIKTGRRTELKDEDFII